MTKNKDLLFSVTADDCEFEYYRGSGSGGQKKNKTSSAVRCRHKLSGAVGQCQEGRSQKLNKRTAFKRMAESKEFNAWIKVHVARLNGAEGHAKAYADKEINSDRVRVEVKKDGKWVLESEIKDETEMA